MCHSHLQIRLHQIFASRKGHPSVKYMICRNYDGSGEFHGDSFGPARPFGNALYALMWTLNPNTVTTPPCFWTGPDTHYRDLLVCCAS